MKRVLLSWGFALLLGPGVPAQDVSRAASRPGHLLLHVVYDGEGFRIQKRTPVPGPLPKARGLRSFRWQVQGVAADGGVQFERGLPDPTTVRGEFRNALDPDKIDAFVVKQTAPVSFTLRVPLTQARRLDFFERSPQDACEGLVPTRNLRRLGSADLLDQE